MTALLFPSSSSDEMFILTVVGCVNETVLENNVRADSGAGGGTQRVGMPAISGCHVVTVPAVVFGDYGQFV